ncbi:hypothetical protein [Eubacterium sp.]|uniref:hypothetical protein n=1 Tax=Eubacterium sp. TaxID=142586 RepID=UPI00399B2E10
MEVINRLKKIEKEYKNTKWLELIKANSQQIEHYKYIQDNISVAIKNSRKKCLTDVEVLNYIRVMFKDEPYLYWFIFKEYFEKLVLLIDYAYLMGMCQGESLCNKLSVDDMDVLRKIISMNNTERGRNNGENK